MFFPMFIREMGNLYLPAIRIIRGLYFAISISLELISHLLFVVITVKKGFQPP